MFVECSLWLATNPFPVTPPCSTGVACGSTEERVGEREPAVEDLLVESKACLTLEPVEDEMPTIVGGDEFMVAPVGAVEGFKVVETVAGKEVESVDPVPPVSVVDVLFADPVKSIV
jgi:hypothetical protein